MTRFFSRVRACPSANCSERTTWTLPRDYDVAHYARVLRDGFASRLARAFTPDGFHAVFDDPDQPSLFARLDVIARPILTVRMAPPEP